MKLLIVYGTTEGHTGKVSNFLKEEAGKLGHQVELCNASDDPPSPQGYDLVLIGGSVHQGKYQSTIKHYVKEHHQSLNQVTSAFFSVSLAAVSTDEESWKELQEIAATVTSLQNCRRCGSIKRRASNHPPPPTP